MFGTLTILIIILSIVITAQNMHPSSTERTTVTSTPTPPVAPTDKPTITPLPTPTPTAFIPTPQPTFDNQSSFDFKYPNSTIISQNGNEIVYESTDDPKKITDWYKDKINSVGMKATSFVQTSTNGNILNKLVGANANKKVSVEISKQNNNAVVRIVVVSN